LPPADCSAIESLSCLYGADHLAAQYCGFKSSPSVPDGHWQHGWIPQYHAISPAMVICGEGDYPEKKQTGKFFVARQDEVDYLRGAGYRHVEAIGLPVTYLKPVEQQRLRSRLLVMPVHSLETTSLRLDFESYADAIDQIRDEFEEVVICVHPSCYAKGYWVENFEQRGYPIVTGASLFDRKGLHRMQRLMSGFEFITSNGFGSFLAYGAYFGARVSVYGPDCERSEEDYKNLPSNHGYPDGFWKLETQTAVKREYPFLFGDPWGISSQEKWGRLEVGADQVPTPHRLRKMFGWTPKRVIRSRCLKAMQAIRGVATRKFGHYRKLLTQPGYRELERAFQPASAVPAGEMVTLFYHGKPLKTVVDKTARQEFQEVFIEKRFRFHLRDRTMRLIDGYAGSGFLAAFLKTEYPDSELTVFEPRGKEFVCLQENAKELGIAPGNVVKGRPGMADESAYWLERGVAGRRMLSRKTSLDSIEIESRDLRKLLDIPVGFLRLELTDAEVDLLEEVADKLGNVENLVVEYRALFSGPQRLASLMTSLGKAGFRTHIKERFGSPNPLFERNVDQRDFASDHRVTVFAFRV
jgi:hypothetical protein